MVDFREQHSIDLDLLERLRSIFGLYQDDIYLVGGAVRDLFLRRTVHDLDFAVSRKAIKLTFQVADKLGYPAYVLDQERDAARIVFPDKGITIDIAALRRDTLEEDLRLRDFTINAMALPALDFSKVEVVDPYGGLSDLDQKIIRPTNDDVFSSDPLRALRAVRLAVELDFSLSPDAEELIKTNRILLKEVSGERIRDEFVRILNSPKPAAGLEYLRRLGLYPYFALGMEPDAEFGEEAHIVRDGIYSATKFFTLLEKLNAWLKYGQELDYETSNSTSDAFREYKPVLGQYFGRDVEGGLSGWTILKMGALFAILNNAAELDSVQIAQVGRDSSQWSGRSPSEFVIRQMKVLKLSRAAHKHLLAIVAGGHRQLISAAEKHNSRREIYRYFRANTPAGVDIAWISIVSALAAQLNLTNPQKYSKLLSTVSRLFESYFWHYDKIIKPSPVIDGTELMKELRLQPGPELGRLLDIIEEGQAAGEIETREQAIVQARN